MGASVSVVLSLVTLDIDQFQKFWQFMTVMSATLYVMKFCGLLFLGGLAAYLRRDEELPLNLVVTGALAPTLFVAWFNSQYHPYAPVPIHPLIGH